VGTEERVSGKQLKFIGTSQVTSPDGEVLLRAGSKKEEAAAVEIDPAQARKKLITPLNDIFKDRRKDLFLK
jgi:predicted amidohydrolase